MRNTVMTGPIILSKEDSSRLRQNILHPTVEYLQEQERYFEEIASSMIIHKEGSNTRVEFKDLDLCSNSAPVFHGIHFFSHVGDALLNRHPHHPTSY